MNVIESLKEMDILKLMNRASEITLKHHGDIITLERAVFLSWWCERGDCAFCYMSTQKPRIREPSKARRNVNAILAEAEICRRLGWNIEFLSGGYGSFSPEEIKEIAERIRDVTGSPVWLNTGITTDLEIYGDEVEGITGALEVANPDLQSKLCPSKPREDIAEMLETARALGFRKGITIILGLGETPDDLRYLFEFIGDLEIDRVTFYALNPHEGTVFENQPQPATLYYAGTVAATRIEFPDLEIITGTWMDNLGSIGPLVLSGANGITKFPLFKMFGTSYGKRVEEEVRWAGRRLAGTFTDVERLRKGRSYPEIDPFIERYVKGCLKNLKLL
ncbi:radical SAM protein [Methanothermobacter sp.]|uniref:radical SAM protein n=1 Tax=Methanothermobacter sp. TaxID=1884223 RepID=UPI00262ABEDB|nr:radical SAM protein [Methanothermobacter sp.]MDI9614803.1 radical SAM protein [Methanothermobacter sp.]